MVIVRIIGGPIINGNADRLINEILVFYPTLHKVSLYS